LDTVARSVSIINNSYFSTNTSPKKLIQKYIYNLLFIIINLKYFISCGVGAEISVIKSIVDCYPEAVLMRTNKGSTAKQCLSLTNAANKADVKRMLQDIYNEVEQRYRPAQTIESERVLV